MLLDSSNLATWDTLDGWVVNPGDYVFRVGTSSRDLPLEAVVVVQ